MRIPAAHVIRNMMPEEKQIIKTAVLRSRQNFLTRELNLRQHK